MPQFGWTLVHERVGPVAMVAAIAGVLTCNLAFHWLYRWGERRRTRAMLLG